MKLAIIDTKTNLVTNVTVPWRPPAGCIAVEVEDAAIGWLYDPATGVISKPPQPEDGVDEPPTP